MAVSDWSTTAASNGTTLGINIAEGCDAANVNNALREMMAQLRSAIGPIPAGTVMLFAQTTAPTGWTKLTSHNDKVLRVVSVSAGSGGSADFSSVFGGSLSVTGTVGGHSLSVAELPAHKHGNGVNDTAPFAFTYGGVASGPGSASENITTNSNAGSYEGYTATVGSGDAHSHSFSAGSATIPALKYVDCILASRVA